MRRLPALPGQRIARERVVRFTFDGRTVEGYDGDTIGSALFAAGQRTFSRSFKYHRRRGLMCCAGQCPNCLVAVDGAPGVRACVETLKEGMRVQHMNARPSLEFDAMRATDLFGGPFTPPGFYYKTFIRPRRLWPLYERVLRNAAGLGVLRSRQEDREWRTEYRRRHVDVLVVGGGVAGLRAAATAADLGADVALVDEGAELGGSALVGVERAQLEQLIAHVHASGVEVIERGSALGYYDGLVAVWQGSTLHQIRSRQHIFATGSIEQPLVFAGNDLPGVMLCGGALRLLKLYAVAPGDRAVVVSTGDRGLQAAIALHRAGVWIAAVADLRPEPGELAQALRDRGVEVLAGHTVARARGGKALERVELEPVAGGRRRTFECDLLAVSGGFSPASSLPLQAGARAEYDPARGQFAIASLPDGVHAAGELAGAESFGEASRSGALAALVAAHALGLGDGASRAEEHELARRASAAGQRQRVALAPPVAGEGEGKCFACFCEDVTSKDIAYAISEGYDSIELAKRYTTVTMGPCQGRMCHLASIRLMAQRTGQSLAQVGTTTARPPWTSVPMGVLAGRPFQPAKRSAIHERHRQLGATIRWAGDWRRAYDYGDPEGEALAVHQAAGLIDVSTLGKLLVRGPDAGAFLDRLYPNRHSNLKPARIRYGVISSDAGRIVDDGTVCRLDDQTFYVTTTSSGAGAVEEWFSWWLADWRMQVHLTDLTQALCAVNLAGPRARAILSSVSDLDCSADAFTYLDARRAAIAGVPCLILRIGFVGELGYEIHFPAAHGEHVWDALMQAGAEHGIRPFGLEPQRILRLQKLHILVGQDTDSESTPYSSAMSWIVKLDKQEDFIGKWALEHYAQRPSQTSLIGFTLANGHVPTEGAVVLDANGSPAGQVTSARRSPVLGKVIGMAWVPSELADDGGQITISDGEQRLQATLQTQPFYDPEGEVLRS